MLTALMAAAALSAANPPAADPVMTVRAAGLDLASRSDVNIFVDRVLVESRRFCALHRARITPDHVDEPAVCERAMADAAVQALPTPHWRRFVGAGGVAALHRRRR